MALNDKIYGREVMVRPRKIMVTGRGGSGNARKSISSASTCSTVGGSISGPASSLAAGSSGSDRSARTRRWSSASNDFQSVIDITNRPGEADGYDLRTISSQSVNTNNSGALSDIPSYISEFTFRTSSNPSANSRPSTMSSFNTSHVSGHSDWLSRIPKSYSSDSLPIPIPDGFEETPVNSAPHQQITFRNPFENNSSGSLSGYTDQRRPIEVAPFDDAPTPTGVAHTPGNSPNKATKGPRVFRVFRRAVPSPGHSPPSAFFGFPSKVGQSSETLLLRRNSTPVDDNLSILDIRRASGSTTTTTARSFK